MNRFAVRLILTQRQQATRKALVFSGGDRGAGAREIRGREAGEERAGSGSSKRAGSGREMRNANYFNLTMR